MFMYYTVCYFTGIFYAVVRQISMLFIDNQILYSVLLNLMLPVLPNTVIITVVFFLFSFFFSFFFGFHICCTYYRLNVDLDITF